MTQTGQHRTACIILDDITPKNAPEAEQVGMMMAILLGRRQQPPSTPLRLVVDCSSLITSNASAFRDGLCRTKVQAGQAQRHRGTEIVDNLAQTTRPE
jgi:hypothetical protein